MLPAPSASPPPGSSEAFIPGPDAATAGWWPNTATLSATGRQRTRAFISIWSACITGDAAISRSPRIAAGIRSLLLVYAATVRGKPTTW